MIRRQVGTPHSRGRTLSCTLRLRSRLFVPPTLPTSGLLVRDDSSLAADFRQSPFRRNRAPFIFDELMRLHCSPRAKAPLVRGLHTRRQSSLGDVRFQPQARPVRDWFFLPEKGTRRRRRDWFWLRHRRYPPEARDAYCANLRPVVRMHRRIARTAGHYPLLQRLKQVTDIAGINTLADFKSTTPGTFTNRW